MPLPVAGEVRRDALAHNEAGELRDLIAVRNAAVILAPRTFLRVTEQIGAGDVMEMTDLGAAQAAEIFLGPIGAGAVERIGFLMVDALDLKVRVEPVP